MVNTLLQAVIPTPDGPFLAIYSRAGLCALQFPGGSAPKPECLPKTYPPEVQSWHELTVASVREILSGRPSGPIPPLDLASATDFQRSVWAELRRIGPGQTRSYAEIAEAIGRPTAARAVGAACGANPIPLLIPCHRVLAANKKLGGFSGGLHWKRLLLSRERSWLGE